MTIAFRGSRLTSAPSKLSYREFLRLIALYAGLNISEYELKRGVRELRLMIVCDDICSKEFPKNKEVCIQHCIQFFKNYRR